jgi:hypothetical protein
MLFNYLDFQEGLAKGLYSTPSAYRPFMSIKRTEYAKLEKQHLKKDNDAARAFRELRRRVGKEYYWKCYPVQAQAMDYSQLAFPAYRFILPEVLADDWLATVGWHKFNRDHILHQPLTAYIVLKMLTGENSGRGLILANGISLLDACVNEILKWQGTAYLRDFLIEIGVRETEPWLNGSSMGQTLWRSLFIETAYLAAVFHDMGYPWQYVNLLTNNIEHVDYSSDSPVSDAKQLLEIYGERLLFCPYNGYRFLNRATPSSWHHQLNEITAKALRKTHGLPGAIGFLYLNDVLKDYPNDKTHPIRQFCVEWAAMAIMMHDMPQIYWDSKTGPPSNGHIRLKFNIDPLSCVIALADELEDFARPIAYFSDTKVGVECEYKDSSDECQLEIQGTFPSAVMKIEYKFKNKDQCIIKRHSLVGKQIEYFDAQYGYLDFSGAGIKRVEMTATTV